jgi:hypothetical protein
MQLLSKIGMKVIVKELLAWCFHWPYRFYHCIFTYDALLQYLIFDHMWSMEWNTATTILHSVPTINQNYEACASCQVLAQATRGA